MTKKPFTTRLRRSQKMSTLQIMDGDYLKRKIKVAEKQAPLNTREPILGMKETS